MDTEGAPQGPCWNRCMRFWSCNSLAFLSLTLVISAQEYLTAAPFAVCPVDWLVGGVISEVADGDIMTACFDGSDGVEAFGVLASGWAGLCCGSKGEATGFPVLASLVDDSVAAATMLSQRMLTASIIVSSIM